MSLETIAPLSDDPIIKLPEWQLDRSGPAGDHDGLAVVTPLNQLQHVLAPQTRGDRLTPGCGEPGSQVARDYHFNPLACKSNIDIVNPCSRTRGAQASQSGGLFGHRLLVDIFVVAAMRLGAEKAVLANLYDPLRGDAYKPRKGMARKIPVADWSTGTAS